MLSDWKTMHQALSHIHAILYVVFTYSYTYTSEKITNKWHLSATPFKKKNKSAKKMLNNNGPSI